MEDHQNHQHPQLQPNQIFYNAQFDIDTMGKVPQNPDDIYPYATFVLPDADCGAGNKVQIAAYQEVSDVKRQQIVLNPQDNIIMGPQISTLVFQEQSTLPLSDALSSSTNQYQTVQQHTMTNTATGPRKRQRKKRSSAKQQPSMGLASLRQHQNVTLRRSEECLNTSTPESSTSESDHDQDLDNEPVWTRQVPPAYGRGVPPADTDTLPSSEDEYHPRPQDGVSPQSEDQQHQCIFVKNTNGPGFVGLTPNQLQHIQISAAKTGTGSSPLRRNRK